MLHGHLSACQVVEDEDCCLCQSLHSLPTHPPYPYIYLQSCSNSSRNSGSSHCISNKSTLYTLPQTQSILFTETGSLTSLGLLLNKVIWSVSPRNPSVSTLPVWIYLYIKNLFLFLCDFPFSSHLYFSTYTTPIQTLLT